MSNKEKMLFLFAAILVSILSLAGAQEDEASAINQMVTVSAEISDLVAVVCHYEAIDQDVDQSERTHISPYTYILRDQLDDYVALQVRKNQESMASFDEMPKHWHYINRQLTRIRVATSVSLQPNFDDPSIMELSPDNWEAVYVSEVSR